MPARGTRVAGSKAMKKRRRTPAAPKLRNALRVASHRKRAAAALNKKVALPIRDRDEALEQLAATSEILRVISSSPGELQTVFQVLLGNALRLCVADFGLIFQIHGSGMKLMAHRGASRACLDYMRRGLDRPGPDTLIAQVIKSRAAVQFDDYARSQAISTAILSRSWLSNAAACGRSWACRCCEKAS